MKRRTSIRLALGSIMAWCGSTLWARTPDRDTTRAAHRPHLTDLENEVMQLHVQLAGCGVAAIGTKQEIPPGSYGWSVSCQDVLDLREKYDALLWPGPPGYAGYQASIHWTDREILVLFVNHEAGTQRIVHREPIPPGVMAPA